jgi:hypothetical protein
MRFSNNTGFNNFHDFIYFKVLNEQANELNVSKFKVLPPFTFEF